MRGTMRAKPLENGSFLVPWRDPSTSLGMTEAGRAPKFFAQSGIAISPVRVNWRSSSMETPLCESRASSRNRSLVISDQGMTLSAGSASYGNQTAAAAAEVVCWPISSAKIVMSHPPSAKRTPQLSPETPAPMMAARFRTRSGFHHQNGRATELASAQSRESFICLCQRKSFGFGPYRDARRYLQKLLAIAPGQIRDRTNRALAP